VSHVLSTLYWCKSRLQLPFFDIVNIRLPQGSEAKRRPPMPTRFGLFRSEENLGAIQNQEINIMTIENKIYTLSQSCEVISGMEAEATKATENMTIGAIALIASNTLCELADAKTRKVAQADFFKAFFKNNSKVAKAQAKAMETAKVSKSTRDRVRTVMKAKKFWAFVNGHFDANPKQERTASNLIEAFAANGLTSSKLLALAPQKKGDPLYVKVDKLTETITRTESASQKLLDALLHAHCEQGKAIAALAKRSEPVKQAA